MELSNKREPEVAKLPPQSTLVGSGSEGASGGALVGAAPVTQPAALARPQASRRSRDLGWALLYMAPALIIFLAFTFWPFLRSIWLSFNITDQTGDPARFNGVAYYARILNLDGSGRDEYLRSVVTTIEFALLVVVPSIAVAVGLGVLAAVSVRGISIFRTIFTSTVAISVASASVIWALIYNPSIGMGRWFVHLLNLRADGILLSPVTALPAIAFMSIWTGLGFNFIIALSGLQGIPQELYESSRIDGANGWQIFRRITLPLLSPTLLFLLIINTINSFQAFTQFNVLIANEGPEGSTNVLVYALFSSFFKDNRYGFASAIAVVLFVVLLMLSLLQFRLLDRRVHYQ